MRGKMIVSDNKGYYSNVFELSAPQKKHIGKRVYVIVLKD
jgi:hypothetical protein